MPKYEYNVVYCSTEVTTEGLIQLIDVDGKQGWELVNVVFEPVKGLDPIYTMFFKRPLEEEPRLTPEQMP